MAKRPFLLRNQSGKSRGFKMVVSKTWIRQNTDSFEVYINMYVYRKNAHEDKMYQV